MRTAGPGCVTDGSRDGRSGRLSSAVPPGRTGHRRDAVARAMLRISPVGLRPAAPGTRDRRAPTARRVPLASTRPTREQRRRDTRTASGSRTDLAPPHVRATTVPALPTVMRARPPRSQTAFQIAVFENRFPPFAVPPPARSWRARGVVVRIRRRRPWRRVLADHARRRRDAVPRIRRVIDVWDATGTPRRAARARDVCLREPRRRDWRHAATPPVHIYGSPNPGPPALELAARSRTSSAPNAASVRLSVARNGPTAPGGVENASSSPSSVAPCSVRDARVSRRPPRACSTSPAPSERARDILLRCSAGSPPVRPSVPYVRRCPGADATAPATPRAISPRVPPAVPLEGRLKSSGSGLGGGASARFRARGHRGLARGDRCA